MFNLVLFSPIQSTSVHFSPMRSIWFYLVLGPTQFILVYLVHSVHVGLFRSIQSIWSFSVHSVHFDPIQSTLVLIGPLLVILGPLGPTQSIWSYSVYFAPIPSYSVHFSQIWSTLILIGPFCSIWSYAVHFGRTRFILVRIIITMCIFRCF